MEDHKRRCSSHPLTRMAYWLFPAEPVYGVLKQMIEVLARQYDGPVFEPHLTLYCGPFSAGDSVEAILSKALTDAGPRDLKVSGLEFSPMYNKCCFVEFESDPALAHAAELLQQASPSSAARIFSPHLSLLYGYLTPDSCDKIRDSILLPQAIRFDRVSAIALPAQTISRDDVMCWREVYRRSL